MDRPRRLLQESQLETKNSRSSPNRANNPETSRTIKASELSLHVYKKNCEIVDFRSEMT